MRAGRSAEADALDELAREYGVQAAYTDGAGDAREAPREAVAAALQALGAPLDGPGGALGALADLRGAAASRLVEPVVVAWPRRETRVAVRARAGSCVLELEGGGEHAVAVDADGGALLPGALPVGYHRLHVEADGRRAEALVIAPPGRAPDPGRPAWGVFLPLYALPVDGPVASFRDLRELVQATGARGSSLVGTTPLYASFLDGDPFEPSPYSPASRLFWNDLFVDLTALPELARSAEARAALERVPGPPADGLVDYRGTAAARRVVLQALADAAYGDDGRRASLEAHLAATPHLADYAAFRAGAEADPSAARRRHVYAQWVAEQQLAEVARAADAAGSGLYLDLPLGVHRAAYDVAAEPGSFAVGIRAGAPADVLGPAGQDWELPPLHPVGSRETGHRYTIACLRTAFRHARALRIDHVAGFHRLFWIPEGFDATEGLYVRYPAEELYAIVLVEAHRRGAVVIGEDLGTVPQHVHETLGELGILRSYVLQFELGPDDDGPAPDPPPLSLASLGTHDTATFSAWWRHGRDPQAAPAEASRRLAELGAGSARFVLASLEDLWDETRPQNVPGTTGGANWRRRARYDVAALQRLPVVDATFRKLEEARP